MLKRLQILFSLVILVFNLYAQQQQKTPKIGLALSGGGAKGMAHVGVLKMLEELGIVPDYITGVSMGSIVGGLYACGYTADSIEKILKEQDWGQMLSDKIFESDIFFDEKKIFRNELMNLSFENKKINAPGGLVEGQHITEMMNYFTFSVANTQNFDSLSIPYRAVATNIVSCKPVVLKKGNISEAMRASMAVPLVFAPVKIDSLLFVDGGVVRNFAVQELKKMGADIIIGCYTGRELYKKNKLKSLTNIAAQIASFSGIYDAQEQEKLVDVLIKPEFGKLNVDNFGKVDKMIEVGYKAAETQRDTLKKIAKLIKHNKKKNLKKLINIVVDTIIIRGNKVISDKQILDHISIKIGDEVNKEILKNKISKLYGLYIFDKISYKLQAVSGKYSLILDCKEKNKNNINTSLHYDIYSDFGVNINYINRNFLLPKSRFLIQTYFSKYLKSKLDYTVYFGKSNLFNTKIGFDFAKSKLPALFIDEEAREYNHLDMNMFFAFNFTPKYNQNIELSLAMERVAFVSNLNIPERIKRIIYKNITFNFIYDVNNLDRYYFPKKGLDLSLKITYGLPLFYKYDYKNDTLDVVLKRNSLEKFYQIIFRGRYFFSIRKVTFESKLNILLSSSNKQINNYALIGGPELLNRKTLPFWGFHANEFVTQNALGIGGSVRYNLKEKIQIGLHFDLYAIENLRNLEFEEYWGTALDIGYNSPIGPIKIGVMEGIYFEQSSFNNFKFYLSIGFFN